MEAAVLQFAPCFGEVKRNIETVEESLSGVRADLVVLPELCFTGYQFKDRKELASLAEPSDGPSVKNLAGMAREIDGYLVAGFAESDRGRIYNSAALVGPDGLYGVYRKVHLFADEKSLFEPGDLGFPVFRIEKACVGMMICFDWIFPESARSLALAGASVLAHPANLVLPYCQDVMTTRALENRIYTITANRVGAEERIPGRRLSFTGKSRIVDPDGKVAAEGPSDRPAFISTVMDLERSKDKFVTARNHLFEDLRPEQYRRSPIL